MVIKYDGYAKVLSRRWMHYNQAPVYIFQSESSVYSV